MHTQEIEKAKRSSKRCAEDDDGSEKKWPAAAIIGSLEPKQRAAFLFFELGPFYHMITAVPVASTQQQVNTTTSKMHFVHNKKNTTVNMEEGHSFMCIPINIINLESLFYILN